LSQQPLDTTTLSNPDLDTLTQELAAIQQTSSKRIAILGSRHVPIMHQQLIEMMSYALVLGGNRLVTSGAIGTNSAVIKGAMRAESNLLTVILPQSLSRQPQESKEQLEKVIHLIENPKNDGLSLGEASSLCNREIVGRCQQLICFAFHDSDTLLKTCLEAEDQHKIVTLFYFD
jgi:predicted Rossmann fold nucleotide-binding protein DprA/Smf involved in DNA uptake